MSREAYQVPTGTSSQSFAAPNTYGGDANGNALTSSEGGVHQYLCGDCGFKNALRRTEPIRCRECGCRVLYKERTKRMVQFEAR